MLFGRGSIRPVINLLLQSNELPRDQASFLVKQKRNQVCSFGNMGKPRGMPRPLALTGTTVQTETLHEMTK